MEFAPWLDQIVSHVINHLTTCYGDGWTYSRITRGAYFFKYTMRRDYPLGDNRTGFHFFINIYSNEQAIHCAAKLEQNQTPIVPQGITALFVGAPMGHSGDGNEIGIHRIPLPQNFKFDSPDQHLDPEVWIEILTKFLLTNEISTFIATCPP